MTSYASIIVFVALAAQLPALVYSWRFGFAAEAGARAVDGSQDRWFWGGLILGGTGAVWAVAAVTAHGWQGGFSPTLWVSVASTFAAFAVAAIMTSEARRLAPLVFPYMAGLSVLAVLLRGAEGAGDDLTMAVSGGLLFHIVVSVLTYTVATLAAIAALAAFLQERALKAKTPRGFSHHLPSLAFADAMTQRLLLSGEVVLGMGIVSGVAQAIGSTGALAIDHKTVLSILAFGVIGLILWAHHQFGLRGRRAARMVLLAYLLLSLAYPGVKFVQDVILA